MNLGAFAGIIVLENSNYGLKLNELKGLAYTNPLFTITFAICIFGLAGFPITSGFIAKLYLFSAIVRSGSIFIPFLIVLAMTIVVAAYYYTNIIAKMFEKTDGTDTEILQHKASSPTVILYICSVITVMVGVMPAISFFLTSACTRSIKEATLTMKNSSRLEAVILKNFNRSNNGFD